MKLLSTLYRGRTFIDVLDDMTAETWIAVLIAILIFIFLLFWIAKQIEKSNQQKLQAMPLQETRGKIIEKTEVNNPLSVVSTFQYVFDCGELGRIRLITADESLKNMVIGDSGKISYKGNVLLSMELDKKAE